MAWAELRINRGALQEVGMRKAHQVVSTATRRVFNRSQILCPVDTGYLRASGGFSVHRVARSWRGEIEYTANYAAAVHNGRRALTIRSSTGKRLRFIVDGRVVFAREVHQPARAARPYLSLALYQVLAGKTIQGANFRVLNKVNLSGIVG